MHQPQEGGQDAADVRGEDAEGPDRRAGEGRRSGEILRAQVLANYSQAPSPDAYVGPSWDPGSEILGGGYAAQRARLIFYSHCPPRNNIRIIFLVNNMVRYNTGDQI